MKFTRKHIIGLIWPKINIKYYWPQILEQGRDMNPSPKHGNGNCPPQLLVSRILISVPPSSHPVAEHTPHGRQTDHLQCFEISQSEKNIETPLIRTSLCMVRPAILEGRNS